MDAEREVGSEMNWPVNSASSQRRAGQAEYEAYEKEATFSTSFPLMCYHKNEEEKKWSKYSKCHPRLHF